MDFKTIEAAHVVVKVVIWESCCKAVWSRARVHEKCRCIWLLSPEVTAWYARSPPCSAAQRMPVPHGNPLLCIMENMLIFSHFCLWEIFTRCAALSVHLHSVAALFPCRATVFPVGAVIIPTQTAAAPNNSSAEPGNSTCRFRTTLENRRKRYSVHDLCYCGTLRCWWTEVELEEGGMIHPHPKLGQTYSPKACRTYLLLLPFFLKPCFYMPRADSS